MLNSRPSMDVRWPTHHRSVPMGFQVATVVIGRRQVVSPDWNPTTGELSSDDLSLVYLGKARCQPNKDWRARRSNSLANPMVQEAIRVQAPVPDCPPMLYGDIIRVLETQWEEDLQRYIFHVRNPLESSNSWGRSIMADIDLSENSASWEGLLTLAQDAGWEG